MKAFASPRLQWALLTVLLLGGVVSLLGRPVSDPDIWWVAAAGRELLATHDVPRTNLFSFTAPDAPWVMHEWGFAAPYAWGLERFGPQFFHVAALVAFVAAAALLLRALGDTVRGRWLAVLALALFFERLQTARPTHLALVFPVAMAVLAWAPRLSRVGVVLVVVTQALWTQGHGSFPLGVAMVVGGVFLTRTDVRTRWFTAAAAACVTVLNPYGLRLHQLVVEYATGQGAAKWVHAALEEFQPLWRAGSFLGPEQWLGYPLLLVGVVGAFVWRGRAAGVIALVLLALAVSSVRHYHLAGLLMVLLLGAGEVTAPTRTWRWVSLTALALGVLALTTLRLPGIGTPAVMRAAEAFPEGTRVYTPFTSAGLVIWYGWPRARVFIDSRNDCYPEDVLLTALEEDDARAEVTLPKLVAAGTNTLLLPEEARLVEVAKKAGFTEVARDDGWVVLSSGAAR